MSLLTNFQERLILKFLINDNSEPLVIPSDLYLGFFTGDPTEDGLFANEPIGSGYTRITIPLDGSALEYDSALKVVKNKILLEQVSPLTANIGNITYWGLMSGSSAPQSGTMLYYGEVATIQVGDTNDVLSINAGDLKLGMDTSKAGDYLNSNLLRHLFGLGTYIPTDSIEVALSTTPFIADGTGGTEPSLGNGYVRMVIPTSVTDDVMVYDVTNNRISNSERLLFATATGVWGDLTNPLDYYAIFEGSSNNLLWRGVSQSSKYLIASNTYSFYPETIRLTLD